MEWLDEVCDVLTRNRDLADTSARLAPEVLQAGGKGGMWVLTAPREVGGLELSLPDLMAVFEQLGEADATAAWHAANSQGIGIIAAALPESDREMVFASTAAPYGYSGIFTGARARAVEGGYRLEGSWPFMTGARDAAWALVSARLVGDGETASEAPLTVLHFVLPMSQLDVGDTWNKASGMRGTGSDAVSTPGVLVPSSRSLAAAPPVLIDRPLYRLPLPMIFVAAAPAVVVGVLRSAVRGAIALCSQKVSRLDGHAHFDDPRVQQAIADAVAGACCLSAGLGDVSRQVWATAEAGGQLSLDVRARFWSTLFYTIDTTRDLVSTLYAVSTSAVYATRNPVERALRDIHAVSASLESFQSLRRAAARVLMGHEPRHPAF